MYYTKSSTFPVVSGILSGFVMCPLQKGMPAAFHLCVFLPLWFDEKSPHNLHETPLYMVLPLCCSFQCPHFWGKPGMGSWQCGYFMTLCRSLNSLSFLVFLKTLVCIWHWSLQTKLYLKPTFLPNILSSLFFLRFCYAYINTLNAPLVTRF